MRSKQDDVFVCQAHLSSGGIYCFCQFQYLLSLILVAYFDFSLESSLSPTAHSNGGSGSQGALLPRTSGLMTQLRLARPLIPVK